MCVRVRVLVRVCVCVRVLLCVCVRMCVCHHLMLYSLTLFVELIEASLPEVGRAPTELGVPFSRGDLPDKIFQ